MKLRLGLMLLAVLLAVMAIIPGVSAATTVSDFEKYSLPKLTVNKAVEPIPISGALSPESNQRVSGVYRIPTGSIIEHTVDGMTLIFDQKGNHFLSISDVRSEKIPTPAGIEKPATMVHQVPNDARIYYEGNRVFVTDQAGELILVVIDDRGSSTQPVGIASEWNDHDWVEDAEAYPNYITENIAYWTVPSSPPSLESGEMIYLFNSIKGVSGSKTYLLQPVLRYYGNNQRWEGQAWACDVYGPDDFVGPLFTTAAGRTMKGRIYWSTSLNTWSITLYDQTTGQYSSLSTNCISPQTNSRVAVTLEGWYIDDNTDVPGDTLFYDMSYKSYGTPMSITLSKWYSSKVPYVIMQYCYVDIVQNPSRVRLNTYN